MNNLLYLYDIRKDNKNKEKEIKDNTLTGKSIEKNKNKMNKIIKEIFILKNKTALINIINYIYNDKISCNTEIQYLDEQSNINYKNEVSLFGKIFYDIRILAKDNKRIFIYDIQIKTKDIDNISIRIFKYNLNTNNGQDVQIDRQNYKEFLEKNDINLTQLYEIVLNSNTEVPDIYNFKVALNNKNLEYKIKVLKSWKYDFKGLYDKNMTLLMPLKVLDLKNRLVMIKREIKHLSEDRIRVFPQKTRLKNYIKDETYRFFYDMNIFLEKAKHQEILHEKDILKFNLIAIELLSYLNECEDLFLDMKEMIYSHLKNKYIK